MALPVTLNFDATFDDFIRLQESFSDTSPTWKQGFINVWGWAVTIGALVGFLIFLTLQHVSGAIYIAIGAFVVTAAYLGWLTSRETVKRTHRICAEVRGNEENVPVEVIISQRGIEYVMPSMCYLLNWPAVTNVYMRGDDIIVCGRYEGMRLLIPDRAFPDPDERSHVFETIQQHANQGRDPAALTR